MNSLPTLAELAQRPFVEERLKAIASQLIAAHRRHDPQVLLGYARQAGISEVTPQKLFMRTIQVFHPDRTSVLWERLESARSLADADALEGLRRLLELRTEAGVRRVVVEDFEAEEEEYGFDEDDFGYDLHEADDSSDDEEWDPDAGTFYSAVKRALFGNLDLYPDAADLAKLAGELDLSDWDLHDLEGIEHCVSITTLNLSRNRIDNVYPLKDLVRLEALDLGDNDLEDADWLAGLVNLQELDLSANDIDDIAFLDRLPRLKYVDLTGNPVRNKAVVARLESRGVIVIA